MSLTPEEVREVRAAHKGMRDAGLVASLLGVLLLLAGRYMAGAPAWLMSAGLGVIVFGWGLMIYAMIRRISMARDFAAGRRR